jgi:hypothetical protein
MNDFLEEFQTLLEKYNVAIVRSASEKNELVISKVSDNSYVDLVFQEEISKESLKNGWFEIV